ncbi:hypothetical protein IT411_00140 [Candidatus Peregrinibacteria bacterium]|nr:hypothetical protein [Candidatus Peregrinibacteria bacterium]
MSLFAKKYRPIFTDEEFVAAKEADIVDTLWQEEQFGLNLFTPEQRKAINENRRATFLAVNLIIPLKRNEKTVIGPISAVNQLPVSNDNSEKDQSESSPDDNSTEAVESSNLAELIVDKYEKAIAGNEDMMGESKLRAEVKRLRAELGLVKRPAITALAIGFVLTVVSGFLVIYDEIRWRKHLDQLKNSDSNSEIQKEYGRFAEQVDYEQRRGRQLESNFAVSEYYRLADKCDAKLTIGYLKSENLNLSGIRKKAKTPAVCKELEEFEIEGANAIEACQKVVDYNTKNVVEERILEGIKKDQADFEQIIAKISTSYSDYLKANGYAQCESVARKK